MWQAVRAFLWTLLRALPKVAVVWMVALSTRVVAGILLRLLATVTVAMGSGTIGGFTAASVRA